MDRPSLRLTRYLPARSFATLMLVALAVVLAPSGVHGAERRTIEAEEFQGLKRYPYFRDREPGWYALEGTCRSYGAPGKGYFAMIHEGAKNRVATKTLTKPLPAGEYQVFISSCGLYWADKSNIVAVRMGGAESRIEWDKKLKKNKFRWFKGTNLTLKQPATKIELEAVQFGGKGYAHIYEPSTRTIPVDQIYVTSDLTEKTGPSIQGYHVITSGRDEAAQVIAKYDKSVYRNVDVHGTPAAENEPQFTPVALQAFDGRKNLWPNSSFEGGGSDGWATNSGAARGTYIFSERDHIRETPFHGAYCMRFPGNLPHFSRVVMVVEKGRYTLSAYARGKKAGGKLGVSILPIGAKRKIGKAVISAKAALSTKWQRLSATGELEAGPVILGVYGACDLDALQLEKGAAATAYAPRATIEAGLATPYLGHIMYSDRPVTLTAWASNSGAQNAEAKLRYRIVDVRERLVADASVTIPVPAGQTVSRPVIIEPQLRGLFSAVYSAHGGLDSQKPVAEGELVYSVLPPIPKEMPRHAVASNMDNVEAVQELMARMGHKWQLYCKLYIDKPGRLCPKPGEFKWEEARNTLTMAGKYGMRTMPALWPGHLPTHLKDPYLSSVESYADKRSITRQIKHVIPGFPDLKKWKEYCKEVALNLGDKVQWWTIDDETEMYYSPAEFARITKATVEGFAASGKPMKVTHSCMGDYTEEMLAELGDEVQLGGFGSSSYNYEYWDARKVQYLQKRYGLPWSCIGVGSSRMPQFQHSIPGYSSLYNLTARTAREMVFLTLVQDARVIGHYTGRMWMRGSLINTDYPLMDYDGTPLSHGFTYSCIPLLLANAEPVEDIYLDKLRTVIIVFRQNGQLGACTWANNFHGLDIHWKTEPRQWKDFTLPGAAGKVQVAGMYGNPRPDAKTTGGNVVFDLNEEPTFIFNQDLGDAAFLDMLRNATAAPRPLDLKLAFVPNGQGGVDLGVRATNTTQKAFTGMKLDANFPPNRMVSRTRWMLPESDGTIGDIAAGATTWGRIRTTAEVAFPIENATFMAWVTDATGKEHPIYDTCWMTVAPRLQPKLDGVLSEWDAVHPAWMHYTYSWGRFGRHIVQFEKNGEHFKYCWRTDARAAIYSAWDDQNLYLAIRCEDDDLVASGADGDRLEIKLNPAAGEVEGTKTYAFEWQKGKFAGPDGIRSVTTRRKTKSYHVKDQNITVWTTEMAIPLDGLNARPGSAAGFDVLWHDADADGKETVTGTWRWAGRSTSLGTLFFGQ